MKCENCGDREAAYKGVAYWRGQKGKVALTVYSCAVCGKMQPCGLSLDRREVRALTQFYWYDLAPLSTAATQANNTGNQAG